jgi:polysaccharide biosynthesis protein PslH
VRILVVATALPFPPVSGGGLRTYHVTRALATRHAVTLVGFVYDGETIGEPAYPVTLRAIPWRTPPLYQAMESDDRAEAARAALVLERELDEPWISSYYESEAMRVALAGEAARGYDLALFLGSDTARYVSCFDRGTPIALDFMDVLSLMAERAVSDAADAARREAARTRSWESGIARRADLLFACSKEEAQAAERLLGVTGVRVVPNGVDTRRFVPPPAKPETRRLLFAGHMGYAPNRDAARWFAREVMPRLRASGSAAVLDVVGARSREDLSDLAASDVVLHGLVPDTLPYQHQAAIVVAPILAGGGTRLKILEAAASGNAVVSTSLGAEGLGLVEDEEIVLADDAPAMARAIDALLAQPERRHEIGKRARAAVLRYDWERIETDLAALFDQHFGWAPAEVTS